MLTEERKMQPHALAKLAVAYLWLGLLPAAADIFVIRNQGNTLVPAKETQISMESETVALTPAKHGGSLASCSFTMKSHAKERVTRKVAFPVVHPMYGKHMVKHFKLKIDGTPQQVNLEMKVSRKDWETQVYYRPDHKTFSYPGMIWWETSWEPGQTRRITCSYHAGAMDHIAGLVRGGRLRYVVRTGALWLGNIGTAEISVRFPADPRRSVTTKDPENTLLRTSYPDQAEWLSDTEVRWRFKEWAPKEDIAVEVLAWRGLPKGIYRDFFLPKGYRGAEQNYTVATVQKLAQRETDPWAKLFPKQVGALDRGRLEAAIADILYHEILARHGYAFVIGKYKGKPGHEPTGVGIMPDGTMMGVWYGYFTAYALHGGWYRSDRSKTRAQVGAELNEVERSNLAFLAALGAKE